MMRYRPLSARDPNDTSGNRRNNRLVWLITAAAALATAGELIRLRTSPGPPRGAAAAGKGR